MNPKKLILRKEMLTPLASDEMRRVAGAFVDGSASLILCEGGFSGGTCGASCGCSAGDTCCSAGACSAQITCCGPTYTCTRFGGQL